MRRLERRLLKRVALVILFGLLIALAPLQSNAQTIQETQAGTSARPPALFLDRRHVAQGGLSPTLDPARITEAAKESIANLKRDWNIIVDVSGHGMKQVKVPFGVRITMEKARKTEPWLRTDRPWEDRLGAYHQVLHEDGKYRLWYHIMLTDAAKETFFPPGGGVEPVEQVLSYAESDDGFHWTKPELDVFRLNGRPTNVVTPYCRESGVFRDPTAPASERYKCFHFDKLPGSEGKPPRESYGLYGLVSPEVLPSSSVATPPVALAYRPQSRRACSGRTPT
jgi:hypothetical protein